jgi:hypothetical protein
MPFLPPMLLPWPPPRAGPQLRRQAQDGCAELHSSCHEVSRSATHTHARTHARMHHHDPHRSTEITTPHPYLLLRRHTSSGSGPPAEPVHGREAAAQQQLDAPTAKRASAHARPRTATPTHAHTRTHAHSYTHAIMHERACTHARNHHSTHGSSHSAKGREPSLMQPSLRPLSRRAVAAAQRSLHGHQPSPSLTGRVRCRCEPSPGADVAGGEPSPSADVARASPVPAQMWQRCQS